MSNIEDKFEQAKKAYKMLEHTIPALELTSGVRQDLVAFLQAAARSQHSLLSMCEEIQLSMSKCASAHEKSAERLRAQIVEVGIVFGNLLNQGNLLNNEIPKIPKSEFQMGRIHGGCDETE